MTPTTFDLLVIYEHYRTLRGYTEDFIRFVDLCGSKDISAHALRGIVEEYASFLQLTQEAFDNAAS